MKSLFFGIFTLLATFSYAEDEVWKKDISPASPVVINQVSLPAYNVTVQQYEYGEFVKEVDGEKSDIFLTKLTANQLNRLEVFHTYRGSILVPRSWKVLAGGISHMDSYLDFGSADQKYQLKLRSINTNCSGCLADALTDYFKEVKPFLTERERQITFKRNNPKIQLIRKNSQKLDKQLSREVVLFRDNQKQSYGIAWGIKDSREKENSGYVEFHEVELNLPEKERDLANALLYQFLGSVQ